ncbi:hypothetical protein F5Y16DRAFT_165416 [Xylariaceae sp. FL0255]|nr:hypothetical protein F5Y16DRAFT_165416 [Xylariaceae sp. FL0255]
MTGLALSPACPLYFCPQNQLHYSRVLAAFPSHLSWLPARSYQPREISSSCTSLNLPKHIHSFLVVFISAYHTLSCSFLTSFEIRRTWSALLTAVTFVFTSFLPLLSVTLLSSHHGTSLFLSMTEIRLP